MKRDPRCQEGRDAVAKFGVLFFVAAVVVGLAGAGPGPAIVVVLSMIAVRPFLDGLYGDRGGRRSRRR